MNIKKRRYFNWWCKIVKIARCFIHQNFLKLRSQLIVQSYILISYQKILNVILNYNLQKLPTHTTPLKQYLLGIILKKEKEKLNIQWTQIKFSRQQMLFLKCVVHLYYYDGFYFKELKILIYLVVETMELQKYHRKKIVV